MPIDACAAGSAAKPTPAAGGQPAPRAEPAAALRVSGSPAAPARLSYPPEAAIAAELPQARGFWADAALLAAIGLALGLIVRGHYLKPHGDFFEFRESGRALLRGELPDTLKRAPLFPLAIARGGDAIRAVRPHAPPPPQAPAVTSAGPPAAAAGHHPADQAAAEWLNTCLLALNGVLTYAIGFRWIGRTARWPALLFLLTPIGLYCTAHAIVEPLLVCAGLTAVLCVARAPVLAWTVAALTPLVRYDAAAILPGVLLARGLRAGASWRRELRGALLACLPLAGWLALTAALWTTHSRDHYISQMLESPRFDLPGTLRLGWAALFDPQRLRLPVVAAPLDPLLRTGLAWTFAACAALGAGRLLVRRDATSIAAVTLLGGFTVVHALFPFDFVRFGYPAAALLLLWAAVGADAALRCGAAWLPSRWLRGTLGVLLVCLLLPVIWGEWRGLRDLASARPTWEHELVPAALGATVLVWASRGRLRTSAALVALVACAALATVQARVAVTTLGAGDEMRPLIQAVSWLADHARPQDRVLSPVPGLLRLHLGDQPHGRFVGLEAIPGETFADALAACRAQGIRYVLWYDLFGEQGDYYIGKWRLQRFAPLSDPPSAPLSLAAEFSQGEFSVLLFTLEGR